MRLAAVALVVAASCRNIVLPQTDLQVSTKLSTAEFRAGDAVEVRVTVTNRGETTHELNVGTCPNPFVVTAQNGTVVGPAVPACTLELRMNNLAAGQSFTYVAVWRGDGLSIGDGDNNRPLPAGTYIVRGRVPTKGGLVDGDAVEVRIIP